MNQFVLTPPPNGIFINPSWWLFVFILHSYSCNPFKNHLFMCLLIVQLCGCAFGYFPSVIFVLIKWFQIKAEWIIKWRLERHRRGHRGFTLCGALTSFSIHGLPLQVAKQPNSPKTIMVVPVPMRTYGALVEFSAIREMYGPSMNFPHSPTAKRMAPVICTQKRLVIGVKEDPTERKPRPLQLGKWSSYRRVLKWLRLLIRSGGNKVYSLLQIYH